MVLVLAAAFKPLGRLVQRIPSAIAAAMLAGILFSFLPVRATNAAAVPWLVGGYGAGAAFRGVLAGICIRVLAQFNPHVSGRSTTRTLIEQGRDQE